MLDGKEEEMKNLNKKHLDLDGKDEEMGNLNKKHMRRDEIMRSGEWMVSSRDGWLGEWWFETGWSFRTEDHKQYVSFAKVTVGGRVAQA